MDYVNKKTTYDLPELSEEEKKLPLAKYYYDYPLHCIPPLQRQILEAGPMKVEDAVPAQRWLDILQPTGYRNIEFGYCMMPDGSGYYAEYFIIPEYATPEMRKWYMHWCNVRYKGMKEENGNLRYKIWMPLDHWEHKYVNGVDRTDGIYASGSLDLGASGINSWEVSHEIDLKEYGLTDELEQQLKDAGCFFSAAVEELEGGGHHLVLRLGRPCPFGGIEMFNHEWIGYYAENGKIIRDENTPVSEEYLKNVLMHNTVEHLHQPTFLPDLYAEYKDQPIDAI